MSTYARFTRFLRRKVFAAFAILLIGFSSGPAAATTFYWDTDGSDSGNATDGTGLGGSGTWDTSALRWWDGLNPLNAWLDSPDDAAVFTYAYPSLGIPSDFGVTVAGGGVTTGALSFLRSGYTLSGGSITLAGSAPTLHVTLGDSATISSNLLGTGGLTKTGGGSIRLTGDNSGLTGGLSIRNGSIIINSGLALPGTGAVSILTNNETPSNGNQVGFFGGSLVLDGTAGGFTLSRDVNLEGRGPIGDRGSAILSHGNNALSGVITSSVSPLTPATFRNSRITSVNGTLDLSGTLVSQGVSATTFLTLGGVNSFGVSSYLLSGVLSGSGSIEKAGSGTLHLNPSDTSGFTGTVRISGPTTGQQNSVRVTQATTLGGTSVFGANTVSGDDPSAIDLNGGILEFRNDGNLDFNSLASGKNVYLRANSTIYTGPAVGGDGINGVTSLGTFRVAANTTATFNSRNGFGVSLGAWTQETSNNPNTIANNMGGTLTFTGNAWNNNDATVRALTIGGNGNTTILGSINPTVSNHNLVKNGTGLLTIQGTGSSLAGSVTINNGSMAITDFRSLTNNTGVINIGASGTGNGAGALIIGTAGSASAAGLTTSKVINLNGTTQGASIIANQAGANPVILNANFTASGAGAKTLTLGGSNTANNVINGSIVNNSATNTTALTKVGAGTWVLAGPNTYTGTTTVSNGTLKIRANGAVSTVLPATNAVTFGATAGFSGGTMEFVGQDSVNNTQNLGTLNYATAGGAHTLKITPGVGGTASLVFANLATGGGGTLNIVGADALSNTVTMTQVNALAPGTGILTRSVYWNGADFAFNQAGLLRAPVYGVDATTSTTTTGPLVAGSNNQITGSFSTGAVSVATLKINGSQTLTTTGTLTLSGGGLLATGGNGEVTGAGTIALGTGAFVIRVNQATDNLLLSTANITGTGGLTKSGAGTLTIATANGRTGTTEIAEGTVRLSGSGTLSGANVTTNIRQAGTLDLNGVSTGNSIGQFNNMGVVTNSGGSAATLQVGNNNGTGTSYGIIQDGAGVVNVTKVGTGNQSWLGESTYTGVTTIGSTGLVTVDRLADGGSASGIGASTSAASNLVFTGSTAGLVYQGNILDGTLILGSRSSSTNRLFTLDASSTGATISSTASNNNAIIWSNTDPIVNNTSAAATLILGGTSTGDNTFNPRLVNSSTLATLSLTKTGSGQWNLGNSNNTYTGVTTISEGILALNENGALPANSPLVLGGATTTGILQMSGVLSRNLATSATPGAGTITWGGTTGSAGFAAHATPLSVSLNGGAGITWASGGFIGAGSLILSSTTALSDVDFTNPIALNPGTASTPTVTTSDASAVVTTADTAGLVAGQPISGPGIPAGAVIVSITSATTFVISANATTALGAGTGAATIGTATRTINVLDNANTATDFANLSGVISGGAGSALTKTGNGILRLGAANTYQGTTQVSAGTLSVSRLGNSATPGATSVGDSASGNTNAGAILLGNGTTGGGILQYTGSGEVSDRKIRLNTTTGGNQIHADGTGALILTNVVNDLGSGAKTLNLRGNNTAGNMITSQLSDNGGALSITVDGGATWILTNPGNNYTGTTTASAGALGIGHNTAIGGALTISNGNVFAYGGDRTLVNIVNLGNNATSGFIGDYSLVFNGTNNLAAGANNLNLYNSLPTGKSVTFNGLLADSLTGNRIWTLDGPGETVVNGNFTTSTTFGVLITKNGDGTLVLGTNGAGSNWNQAGGNIDIDRGTLRFSASEAIPTLAATNGGLIISPEVATTDTATVDLNGTTQTVNALTATSNGVLVLDNTSSNPATFRFGANNSTVNFGSGTGSYSVQNSGAGALSLVKLGNTATTFNSGILLNHAGITASEGGGTFTIAAPVNATSGLRAIGGSTLALTGGLTAPGAITSIEVGGGSTLSLLDGAGSAINSLTNLNLGAGSGTATLNLNIGDGATDTLTLLSGGTLNLANSVTFNLTDSGLSPLTTYTLLNLVNGGITAFGTGNMIQGTTPGGFSGFTWNVTDNLVQITTGTLVTGSLYWRGLAGGGTDTTWNASANNWSQDKSNTLVGTTTPGQGTDVIFAIDTASGDIATTLEQNFKVNSLTFESGATTPTSVTIAPGAITTNRIEVAPQLATDGVEISAGGPASVTISAPFRLGADQTWHVADSGSTLTLSGGLLGERDVTKSGSGRVVLGGAADPTFNAGQTADFTIDGGTLEITNSGALGTLVNNNLARVAINSGGAFYFNGAAATIPNALTLNGGTLSAGTANQIYSGAVNLSGDSFINLRDSNSAVATTTQRAVTLTGVLSGTGDITLDSINTSAAGNQITGDLVISNPGNSGWSGDLIVRSGTVTARSGNSDALGSGAITIELGKVEWEGAGGVTYNINKPLTVARAGGNAVAEWNIDRTSGTGTFAVENAGAVTLGGAGGTGELRVFFNDLSTSSVGTSATFTGAVTLANNAAILSRDNGTLALANFTGGISETGGARSLTINGPAGGGAAWGGTAGIVHLGGAGTYTGGTTLAAGNLRFGNKDAIGTGTLTVSGSSTLSASTPLTGLNAVANAVTLGNALAFSGANSLELAGGINFGGAARILTANGDAGASWILTGALTNLSTADGSAITFAGNATGTGTIRGGFLMTGDAADLTVSGGTWTHETATSRVGDDATITGANAVLNLASGLFQVRDDFTVTANGRLNLNGTGALSFSTATLSSDASLRATAGGTITINANNAVNVTDFDGLRIGTDAGGTGNLVMNANQQVVEFLLGNRNTDRSGVVTGTGSLTVTGNLDLYQGSIAANLASTGSTAFEKISRHTVTLSGNNSGLASTGATIVYEGSLILDYTTDNATKLRAASQLEMRGSNLVLNGNGSAATSQTVGGLTLANGFGSSQITLNPGAGQEVVLNLGAITRAVNARAGTIRFVLPSGTQSATNGVTTSTAAVNGILGTAAFATVDDGNGVWFAGKSGNNIVALISNPKNDVSTWLAGDHVTDVSTGYTGAFSSVALHSFRFDAAAGAAINLGNAGVLGLNTGGLLVTGNVAGTPGILGGTVFSGAQASNVPELILTHDGTTTFEVGADIRANTAFTKSGTGTVRLTGNNTATGFTTVHNGVLELAGGNAIGDNSPVTLASHRNSTLRLLASETIGRLDGGQRQTEGEWGVVEIGGHTLSLNHAGGNTTFGGRFTGTGAIVMTSASNSNLNLNGVSSGFTGTVEVNGGLFQLSGLGRIDASSITVNNNGMMLIDNNGTTSTTNRILNLSAINLNSAAGGGANPRGLWVRNIDNNSSRFETVGDLNFASGTSYLTGEANASSGNARSGIIANNFVRTNDATFSVRGRNLGTTLTHHNQFRIATANEAAFIANLVGGGGAAASHTVSILPWAIGETHNATTTVGTNMGNSFVTYVAGTGLRPLDFATEYDIFATAGTTDNVREVLAGNLTGVAAATVNSLALHNSSAAAAIHQVTGNGAGQALDVTSGAFLFTLNPAAAAGEYGITLGGFDNGITVGATNEYIFHVVNPDAATPAKALTATIGSLLTSTADITKSGRGTLVLTGANTAGGGANKTTINEGVLEIADLDNIGGATGDLVFAGGTLRLGAGFTDDLTTRLITFLLGGGVIDTNGIDIALANSLGSGAGGFTKSGLGNLTLNATASYTGATTLSGGTITIGASNALGVGGNLTIGGGTTLALGTNSIQHGLVTTSGASPSITGTGTINATTGFFLNHTGDTTIDAVLAGPVGLLKAQTNIVTLTADNTYTGTTEIQNGTLSLASIGNVGGGPSPIGAPATVEDGIIRMGLTTAATTLQYTGTGHTSDRLIGMQGTTGGVTLDADGTGALVLGGVRTENAGNKTLTLRGSSAAGLENSPGQIREVGAVLSVLKTDANTWAYNQSQSYTGTTTVDNGILRLNAAQTMTGALQFGSTNAITSTGTLEVKESSAFGSLLVRPNGDANLVVDPTKSLAINGNVVIGSDATTSVTNFTATGGGDFSVNSPTNTGNTFHVGGTGTTNTTLADFSGLASMNISLNPTAGTVLVSSSSGTNSTGKAELRLADTTVITANALTVGGGGTYNGNANQVNQLKLGSAANTFNVNAINIGTGSRDLGSITFQDASGTVTVRAADGTSAAAFNMGTGSANTTAGAAGNENTFDVTGHTADLKFSTVNIGTQNRNSDLVNVFSFDTGTLEIGSLTASTKGSNGNTTTTTINIGGGTVTTGAWTLATTTGAGNAVATANLTGGTVTFSGAINRGTDSAGGGTATGTVNLDGATLNMSGNNIGSATNQIVFNARSGTLQNVGEINGGGDLVKTTAGTLVLAGDNNHTGRTVVNEGVLSVSSEDNLGNNPAAFNAAQLEINGGTLLTTASFTIDDANRGITIGASGGTIETSAGTALTVASTNPIVLTGALTKTGDGALYVNSATSGTGAVNITDGTFGGTGTITGNTTIGNGAILTGGTDGTVGTINFSGTLVNDTGATWLIDLVQDVNGSSDQVNLGLGTLDLNNASLSLMTSGDFTIGNTYTIATYASLLSGTTFNGLAQGAVISGYQIDYGTTAITLTAVPEPGTLGLLGLALGGFFFRRLRKRRSEASGQD